MKQTRMMMLPMVISVVLHLLLLLAPSACFLIPPHQHGQGFHSIYNSQTLRRCPPPLSSSKLPNPFSPELRKVYKDDLDSKIWILLFSRKIAEVMKIKPPSSFITYEDYVDLSKTLMKGGPTVAKESVLGVLRTIAFPGFANIFRTLFPGSSRWACELNANITPIFFSWLVGPAQVEAAEVINPKNGKVEVWKSAVKIQRCRYLEAVQCKGACSTICKVPTQTFFTEDLGMPVTMEPSFEDLSCTMTFGKIPPPLSEDPVAQEKCFRDCPSAQMSKKVCPKITALASSSSAVV